jgi:hypothetical protein
MLFQREEYSYPLTCDKCKKAIMDGELYHLCDNCELGDTVTHKRCGMDECDECERHICRECIHEYKGDKYCWECFEQKFDGTKRIKVYNGQELEVEKIVDDHTGQYILVRVKPEDIL